MLWNFPKEWNTFSEWVTGKKTLRILSWATSRKRFFSFWNSTDAIFFFIFFFKVEDLNSFKSQLCYLQVLLFLSSNLFEHQLLVCKVEISVNFSDNSNCKNALKSKTCYTNTRHYYFLQMFLLTENFPRISPFPISKKTQTKKDQGSYRRFVERNLETGILCMNNTRTQLWRHVWHQPNKNYELY